MICSASKIRSFSSGAILGVFTWNGADAKALVRKVGPAVDDGYHGNGASSYYRHYHVGVSKMITAILMYGKIKRENRMKYYSRRFIKSYYFYEKFFLPDITLEHYTVREAIFRKLGTYEECVEVINTEYLACCDEYFKNDIFFYDDLAKYILDTKGKVKRLDEYTFFKLRYYGTKFLDMVNESSNFFKEETKRFEEGDYPEAIVTLSKRTLHDAHAIFEYNDKILRIIFYPDDIKKTFDFYGVENWMEYEFIHKNAAVFDEELYEESPGHFVYNILWNHQNVNGKNQSEMSIKFTDVIQIK